MLTSCYDIPIIPDHIVLQGNGVSAEKMSQDTASLSLSLLLDSFRLATLTGNEPNLQRMVDLPKVAITMESLEKSIEFKVEMTEGVAVDFRLRNLPLTCAILRDHVHVASQGPEVKIPKVRSVDQQSPDNSALTSFRCNLLIQSVCLSLDVSGVESRTPATTRRFVVWCGKLGANGSRYELESRHAELSFEEAFVLYVPGHNNALVKESAVLMSINNSLEDGKPSFCFTYDDSFVGDSVGLVSADLTRLTLSALPEPLACSADVLNEFRNRSNEIGFTDFSTGSPPSSIRPIRVSISMSFGVLYGDLTQNHGVEIEGYVIWCL